MGLLGFSPPDLLDLVAGDLGGDLDRSRGGAGRPRPVWRHLDRSRRSGSSWTPASRCCSRHGRPRPRRQVEVEFDHLPRLPSVEVDRARMGDCSVARLLSTVPISCPSSSTIRTSPPEADRRLIVLNGMPRPAQNALGTLRGSGRSLSSSSITSRRTPSSSLGPPLIVAVAERELVRRAREMGIHDVRVLDVDHRRLWRSGEQVVRMGGEPLVELVVACDQDGERLLAASTGPADLLPERRNGARESAENSGVEAADVDSEFERTGRSDGPDVVLRRDRPRSRVVRSRDSRTGRSESCRRARAAVHG